MTKFAIGQPIRRLEDEPLVQGKGRYSDDVRHDGETHAYVLRSPHAHALIRGIDTAAAQKAPGVLMVLTGADVMADKLGDIPCAVPMKSDDGSPRGETPRPILATDRVRHVGYPVALVVAETIGQARDAAELIEVDYEPLPAVADTYAAAQDGSPQVWPDIRNNVCFATTFGDTKAADAAFAKAVHVSRIRLVNNRVVANAIEPRVAVADYDVATGRCTLHTPTQGVHAIRDGIARAVLKIDKNELRVLSGQVGGGFGMKIFLHQEQPLVVWASRKLKRPVRWTGERSEGFLSDVQGRDNVTEAELAMDKDGRFLALRATTWANMGAHLSTYGPMIPTNAFLILSGVYNIPAVTLHLKGVVTNTVPVDAYRGAGRPEGIYLVERIVDTAALDLGLSQDEIRRRNFVKPTQMPYRTPMGPVYDTGEFEAAMTRCMEKADWKGFEARRAASAAKGRLRGIGMGMYIERCGGGGSDTVTVSVADGKVTVLHGMQDNGQSHVTTLIQLVSERMGIDAEKIEVKQGDTDLTPPGGTGGSRFMAVSGPAANGAADEAVKQGLEKAAGLLEAAATDVEYRDGEFRIAGTDRAISIFDVAEQSGGLRADYKRVAEEFTYPNGCHIVELEVDPDTGGIHFQRYSIVDDFGVTINPLTLAGQVHGGTVQGIGQALLENTTYDAETAQLLTGSFMDYTMPRADDVPSFDCEFHNVPSTSNPLGVKGAGEAGCVAAPNAVIAALVNALRAKKNDVRHLDMPATRESVWRALAA